MAKRKKFSELSPRAKARAYAAGTRFDLSKQQVARRYNAQTYNPFARKDPLMRLPAEYRSEPMFTPSGELTVDWAKLAERNIVSLLEPVVGEINVNAGRVAENVARASEKIQRIMARATASELSELAHVQENDEPDQLPFDLRKTDIFYVTISQKTGKHVWRNLFWYH